MVLNRTKKRVFGEGKLRAVKAVSKAAVTTSKVATVASKKLLVNKGRKRWAKVSVPVSQLQYKSMSTGSTKPISTGSAVRVCAPRRLRPCNGVRRRGRLLPRNVSQRFWPRCNRSPSKRAKTNNKSQALSFTADVLLPKANQAEKMPVVKVSTPK